MMCSRILRHKVARVGNPVGRFFNRAMDRTVEVYGQSLQWVLRHQGMTLLVTLATLVATVWLYIAMPKGFLPSQDTGLISAVSEAGAEVSFAQMQRLQNQVEAAIKKDPDVVGLVSVLGVSRISRSAPGRAARSISTLWSAPTPAT